MAIPKSTVKILKVLPPFKSQSSLLVMTDHSTLNVQSPKMNVIDLLKTDENSEITEDFKHNTLHVAVSLLKDFYTQLLDLPSCYEIFEQSYKYLQQIPLTYYNDILSNEIRNFITTIEEYKGNRKLEFLQLDKVKPKALRLYDPSIEKVYDAKKHKVQSKEKAERDKLIYKLKKEKKGAMREIRRDKAYLGRVKLDRKLQRYDLIIITIVDECISIISCLFIAMLNEGTKLNASSPKRLCNSPSLMPNYL